MHGKNDRHEITPPDMLTKFSPFFRFRTDNHPNGRTPPTFTPPPIPHTHTWHSITHGRTPGLVGRDTAVHSQGCVALPTGGK